MKHYFLKGFDTIMKITVGDFKDMRGEDMPIILGNCKYVTDTVQVKPSMGRGAGWYILATVTL